MGIGLGVAAVLVAVGGAGADVGNAYAEAVQMRARVLHEKGGDLAQEKASRPPTCLNFPLPTTPVGPKWTKRFEQSGRKTDLTFWRHPCGQGESVVLVTLTPVTSDASFCTGGSNIIQNGVQLSSVYIVKGEGISDVVCGPVLITQTGWVNNLDTQQLDHDLGFIWVDRDFPGDGRISIPAYNPSDYNVAPPPAKITKDYSGSWFTASEQIKNQGWALVFNDEAKMAVAYWFTGSTDGKSLEWFTVVGSYEGDTAEMDIYKTKDVTFVGATGSTMPFGKFTIEFESCSRGVATYDMADGRKGSLPIERLIPAPAGCN